MIKTESKAEPLESESKKYNCILSVDEAEHMKQFCNANHIKWFCSEYWKDRYFQITGTLAEKALVDAELATL